MPWRFNTLINEGGYDFKLLREGAVKLYWSKAVLAEACDILEALDYEINHISCVNDEAFRADLSTALHYKASSDAEIWLGHLDCLNDGFYNMRFPALGKKVLCFHDFDVRVELNRKSALIVLDIIEFHARNYLLAGCLLIGLIQTSSATFQPGPLGARDAQWNYREYRPRDRSL